MDQRLIIKIKKFVENIRNIKELIVLLKTNGCVEKIINQKKKKNQYVNIMIIIMKIL